MADRVFVVVSTNENSDEEMQLDVEVLKMYGDVQLASYEKDCATKLYNKIVDDEKASGKHKFLHIINRNVKLLKDPLQFLEELEDMMMNLKQHVWLNTVCDVCNYVYKKYNPRIRVSFDDDKSRNILKTKSIVFTSNANTEWIAYDLQAPSNKLLKFDERFKVPMFYIIEFLARRRATKESRQMYYMNQYLSVESELGTFAIDFSNDRKKEEKHNDEADIEENKEKMAKDNSLFQSMQLKIEPDNSVDAVLEDLYYALKNRTTSTTANNGQQ